MTKPNREFLSSYLREIAETPSDINEHLELLHNIVAETNAQIIVELGTRSGNSTSALVIGAARTGGRVTSVDHGQGSDYSLEPPTWNSLGQASEIIREKLGLGRYWRLVVKDDLQFARDYDDEIDVLLIDTSHSYEQTRKELEAWGNKVVPGGFIVIHDTVSFPEQNKAIWEFLDNHPSSDYVEHMNCNGLGIIIREKDPSETQNAEIATRRVASAVSQYRLSRMQEALLELKRRLEAVDSERSGLNDELEKNRTELLAIKDSFGYNALRFFTTRIDKLFPDNTKRGDFRRKVVTSLGKRRRQSSAGHLR
jgi:predicted O-methyltransferase YrrM